MDLQLSAYYVWPMYAFGIVWMLYAVYMKVKNSSGMEQILNVVIVVETAMILLLMITHR